MHCAIPWALMGDVAMVHHCGVSCWPRWGVGQGCWVHADGNAPQSEQPIRPLKVPHETCVQCCTLSPTRQCGGWAVQGGEQLGWCVRQGCKVHTGTTQGVSPTVISLVECSRRPMGKACTNRRNVVTFAPTSDPRGCMVLVWSCKAPMGVGCCHIHLCAHVHPSG